ncbi:hypothetical protein [Paenibacillus odorifer]|uniref:hypothetical protein n=1 Tax=Paenibacillus odorifer TaxID=189426 RepID=UPI0009701FE4|nr:hypothetical protein [Paenibacillus odorifer]OMD76889.1 hypothetical protein BSK50_14150 [Paenibacillus odorifer]
MLEFNFLGVAFIADDVPKRKANKASVKMNEIIEKHKELAQKEFDDYLESRGLESAMGVVIPKK